MCTVDVMVDVMAGLLGASFDFSLHDGLCFSTPLPRMPDNLRPDVRHSTSYRIACWICSALYLFSRRSGTQLSYMETVTLLGLAS